MCTVRGIEGKIVGRAGTDCQRERAPARREVQLHLHRVPRRESRKMLLEGIEITPDGPAGYALPEVGALHDIKVAVAMCRNLIPDHSELVLRVECLERVLERWKISGSVGRIKASQLSQNIERGLQLEHYVFGDESLRVLGAVRNQREHRV